LSRSPPRSRHGDQLAERDGIACRQRHLEALASIDGLSASHTGAGSMRACKRSGSGRGPSGRSLMMIDVDHFKLYSTTITAISKATSACA